MKTKLTVIIDPDLATFTLEIPQAELNRAYRSMFNSELHMCRKYGQSTDVYDILLGLSMICRQISDNYKSDKQQVEQAEREAAAKEPQQ